MKKERSHARRFLRLRRPDENSRTQCKSIGIVKENRDRSIENTRKKRRKEMKSKRLFKPVAWLLVLLLAMPVCGWAQGSVAPSSFKQEELEQILAPVALYPDDLLAQIFMASTYPLEIVEADRFAKANANLKGDALTRALEQKKWDPSVKSLVNFPQVLAMMSEKLEWTQKLGDAFIAQQKDVMNTVQKLRAKAQASGNLKTTKEQVVKVEQQTIIIEPASPQVIYVPAYNPTVVYGVWAYPSYPPYPVYPPGYVATTAAFSFMAGAAVGAAWGYAWGHSDWHGGDVNVNVNRNANINRNINRQNYASQYQGKGQAGQGKWQHNPEHRKGVAYRDQKTRQQYGQSRPGAENRKDYRGRTPDTRDRSGAARKDVSSRDTAGRQRPSTTDRGGRDLSGRDAGGPGDQARQQPGKSNAFEGMDRGGKDARMSSDRGSSSRQSMSASRGGRGGGFSGGGRGGGGRGGGRR